MKQATSRLLRKADQALTAARHLAAAGDHEIAVGRAYYAMFHAAAAVLLEKGLSFSKHGAVHGAFGEHFAKTGILDPKYHRWLLEAFNSRIAGDYDVGVEFGPEQSEMVTGRAEEFLGVVRAWLGRAAEPSS